MSSSGLSPVSGPVVLCILDGWGYRQGGDDNAIHLGKTPVWNRLVETRPFATLDASAEAVGLPAGQMGNSEVGHMNIGAGRVVFQDLLRIQAQIAGDGLIALPELETFLNTLKESGGTCHVMGLISPGGVHAHQDHIVALAEAAAEKGVPVRVHGFLDGRDVPPKSAPEWLKSFLEAVQGLDNVKVATICGRFFAMDRDQRWDRVEKAYNAMVNAVGARSDDLIAAVEASHAKGVFDEFVEPLIISGYDGMKDGDGLLAASFRADRARELLTALVAPAFDGFAPSRRVQFAATLGMVSYSEALSKFIPAMFPPESLENVLGAVVSTSGLRQLRIAETEKYAHVTFFLNGGREDVFEGEDRILVPSPHVKTYDLKPEMSAPEVTDRLVEAINSGKYALIIVNYANGDMVGHTGDLNAAIKAVETVDGCLGRLEEAILQKKGAMLITADHGNCEQMADHATGGSHTAHTVNPVPLVLVGGAADDDVSMRSGRLSDLAPILLGLMGLKQPAEMTGTNLLRTASAADAAAAE